MSDKYIIRNCPACCEYTQTYCCEDNYDNQGRDTYCELIDDCVMKQIVEKCKDIKKDHYWGMREIRFSQEILKLLDIQEVE